MVKSDTKVDDQGARLKKRRAIPDTHLPQVGQRGVGDYARRPQKFKSRRRPEREKIGANIQIDVVSDGSDAYCEITDDEGREYVLVLCDCGDRVNAGRRT